MRPPTEPTPRADAFPVLRVEWSGPTLGIVVSVTGYMSGEFSCVTTSSGIVSMGEAVRVAWPAAARPAHIGDKIEELFVNIAEILFETVYATAEDDLRIDITTYTDFEAIEADDMATAMRGFALPEQGGPIQ